MLALRPIGKTPADPDDPRITDAEAAAMARAVVNLFRLWEVADREAAILLGELSPRTWARWKAGAPGRISRDQKTRLSLLMGIHKALRLIFREPERGYGWIRRPNAAFGGAPALEVMLGGEITDLLRVRNYLDAERGGW
ncbi:MbcA/ParS/Xre antitoxin family protein [Cereibacter sphaeroides]|uniref:MbcA/ParS/Xre antitoxin family protein n=1 Tax=Cereibacter sphaeroides TaxID=1063 RepID=UPI001F306E57|nr:MbcA/ParS/Xre antitoxin family protein [Cereibacter sphaeroides]MCE6949807.1 MbcA/ParS/Xre antitoxin family protein [Cereibacter sphaeroides]